MTRSSVFSNPLLLGFEPLEQAFQRLAKASADGYPPYNIEELNPRRLRITVAVAGFTEDELSVTVEGNQLVIAGRRRDDGAERLYIHRGIASRQFQRSFMLADGLEVTGARLDRGLLRVDIDRPLRNSCSRSIKIRSHAGTDADREVRAEGAELKVAGGR